MITKCSVQVLFPAVYSHAPAMQNERVDYRATAATSTPKAMPTTPFAPAVIELAAPSKALDEGDGELDVPEVVRLFPAAVVVPTDGTGATTEVDV